MNSLKSTLKQTFQAESRRGHPLTEEMVLQACREWYAVHGKWPTLYSGLIKTGALAGNKWSTVNMLIRRGNRGLPKDAYTGLADFVEKNQLRPKFSSCAEGSRVTELMVIKSCRDWFATHGEWPNVYSGLIEKGDLAGTNWNAVSMMIRNGNRGLPKGKYKGLGDFKNQHGLVGDGEASDIVRSPQLPPPAP
mgnify:CR=1 FL=1